MNLYSNSKARINIKWAAKIQKVGGGRKVFTALAESETHKT